MTTYRSINDTEVAVDAPLTQQLMQSLRDNILAIQEGDSTAPKIAYEAIGYIAPASGNYLQNQVIRHNYDDDDFDIEFQANVAGTYKFIVNTIGKKNGGTSNKYTVDYDTGGGYSNVAITFTEVLDTGGKLSFTNNGATNHEVSILGADAHEEYIFTFELAMSVDEKVKIVSSNTNSDADHVFSCTCNQRLPLGSLVSAIYP